MTASRFDRMISVAVLAVLLSANLTHAADEEATTVTGRVTLDGQPVADGRILLHFDEDQFIGAKLTKDGTFRIKRVPIGDYNVIIEGQGVPAKYGSEGHSGLRVHIIAGTNEFYLELQS